MSKYKITFSKQRIYTPPHTPSGKMVIVDVYLDQWKLGEIYTTKGSIWATTSEIDKLFEVSFYDSSLTSVKNRIRLCWDALERKTIQAYGTGEITGKILDGKV